MNHEHQEEINNARRQIVEHETVSRRIRSEMRSASGTTLYDLWNEKRYVGRHTRRHSLVLAFLSGTPYRHVEPVTMRDALPKYLIKGETKKMADELAVIMSDDGSSAEAICAWLTTPETAERRSWREARIARGTARRDACRAAAAIRNAKFRGEAATQHRDHIGSP